LEIEIEQAFKDLLIDESIGPTIGGKNGLVKA